MTTLPPGPGIPRVLQMLHCICRPLPFMEEGARAYGDCFTIGFPSIPGAPARSRRPTFVFFSDPEAIREIFTGDGEGLRAGEANSFLEPLLGENSLLLLDGPRHLRERRMMQPPFHGERMQAYGEVMRDITAAVVDGWPVGQTVSDPSRDAAHHPRRHPAHGLRARRGSAPHATARPPGHAARIVARSPTPLLLQVDLGPWSPWGRLLRIGREVDDILFAEIARRRAERSSARTDVLSMLVAARDENGQPMTDQELRDEMFTLLVAGHETTATSLAWAFHRLLANPEALERSRDELRRVAAAARSSRPAWRRSSTSTPW